MPWREAKWIRLPEESLQMSKNNFRLLMGVIIAKCVGLKIKPPE